MVGPSRLAALPAVALCAMALGACGLHLRPDKTTTASRDEIVITQEQIADLGALTAWEAVKRRVPGLTYRENFAGQPTSISRHGRGSIVLRDTPLLFVDGVRVSDIRALGEIPASQVESIHIRTGVASGGEYGTNAASGVILVQTHTGN